MWFKICFISMSLGSIFAVDVGGVVSGNRMAGVPLGISLGSGEVDVEGICRKQGMTCQNCTHAISCLPLPVGWLKIPLQECPGDQTCNAHLKGCTSSPLPECDVISQKYQHKCEQVGIFPDAFDCRKFHLCSPPEGLPDGRPAEHRVGLCPRHYGYDPHTAQCSVLLEEGQCTERPVPLCTRVGQAGALPKSINHYYICLSESGVLTPQVFICPNGSIYSDGYCIAAGGTTQSKTISTTEKPTTSHKESFFSTDKPVTYPADTFLAEKFDFSHNSYDPYSEESWET